MGTTDHYQLTWAVASESSIGATYVQVPDVPVVNIRHLLARLRISNLAGCCYWLTNREFLPTEGVDYKEIEIEAKVGKWALEWYGLTDLVDDFV
jgi:hypothetical protein